MYLECILWGVYCITHSSCCILYLLCCFLSSNLCGPRLGRGSLLHNNGTWNKEAALLRQAQFSFPYVYLQTAYEEEKKTLRVRDPWRNPNLSFLISWAWELLKYYVRSMANFHHWLAASQADQEVPLFLTFILLITSWAFTTNILFGTSNGAVLSHLLSILELSRNYLYLTRCGEARKCCRCQEQTDRILYTMSCWTSVRWHT